MLISIIPSSKEKLANICIILDHYYDISDQDWTKIDQYWSNILATRHRRIWERGLGAKP
jgi:hypothetical protein